MGTKNVIAMGGAWGKKCKRCGRMLPIENFGTHGRYGVKSVCRECEHVSRSKSAKLRGKSPLARFSKEELVAELQSRGLNIMASPTPREMMLKLKAMGYEGELKYTETKTINLAKLD